MQRLLLILLALTLFSACSPAAVQPGLPSASSLPLETAAPSRSARFTSSTSTPPQPEALPSSTNIPTQTAVPFTGLPEPGPYLLIVAKSGAILAIKPDGLAPIPVALPAGAVIPGRGSELRRAVSPDEQWIAYFQPGTGGGTSAGLVLLALADGTVRKIPIEIQHCDYAKDSDAENGECLPPPLAWSPDAQNLAFAAQSDGADSLIASYDLKTSSVQLLQSSASRVEGLEWSPDGEWIVYAAHTAGAAEGDRALYAVRPTSRAADAAPPLYQASGWRGAGWLAPNHYLIEHFSGGGRADLRMFDLQTGSETRLWPRPFYDLAFDPPQQKVLVSGSLNPDRDPRAGLYTFNRFGQMNRLVDAGFFGMRFTGSPGMRFAAFRIEGLFAIADDGTFRLISPHNRGQILPSPNRQWLVVYGEDGADLFTGAGEPYAGITDHPTLSALWQPDSGGVIVSSEKGLVYLAVPDGLALELACPVDDCSLLLEQAAWLSVNEP